MVGLINVLTDIVWRTTVAFYAGNFACKIIKFLQVLVTYASTYVLVSLSIDRYDAITHPLNFTNSRHRARILVATAWILSSLFSVPAIFLNEEAMIKGHPQCWINLKPWQWQIYITLVALSLFFIPAIIISSCYSIIVHTIWNKSQMMSFSRSTYKYKHKKKKVNSNLEDGMQCERSSSRGVIPRAKIKTVKMTFVIVFVFILCWSPYFVWDLLQVYGYIPYTQTTIAISTFIQSLAPLNSAANPLIYCLFSTRFSFKSRKRSIRNRILAFLCCCIPRIQRAYRRDTFRDDLGKTQTSQMFTSQTIASAESGHTMSTRVVFDNHRKLTSVKRVKTSAVTESL